MICAWCDGSCSDADLAPLLHPDLQWMWDQLGQAADRRADIDLTSGVVTLRVPQSPEERAMTVGLLGGQTLRPGQARRVDLAALTQRLHARGPHLTPGAIAAHALQRRLAAKAHARAARAAAAGELRDHLERHIRELPRHVLIKVCPDTMWERLQRAGWIARTLNDSDPVALTAAAASVLSRLPEDGHRADRRTLVPGDPHALDDGKGLAGLVLALANVSARRSRVAWNSLGVDCDDLLGGLIAIGVRPHGWSLPADATVTLPPRELARIQWQPPGSPGSWAFVTENPSVSAAATEIATAGTGPGTGGTVHLLCTAGTPSEIEAQAIGALSDAGWSVAVRADFDAAGLAHVRAVLAAAPAATPWRMDAPDYLASNPDLPAGLAAESTDTPWDPRLATEMTRTGAPAYEESLLPELLADLRAGRPRADHAQSRK